MKALHWKFAMTTVCKSMKMIVTLSIIARFTFGNINITSRIKYIFRDISLQLVTMWALIKELWATMKDLLGMWITLVRSYDNIVSWLGNGLDDPCFGSQHRQRFFFSPKCWDRPWRPPSLSQWASGFFLHWVKWPGCEVYRSPSSRAEMKNEWS